MGAGIGGRVDPQILTPCRELVNGLLSDLVTWPCARKDGMMVAVTHDFMIMAFHARLV